MTSCVIAGLTLVIAGLTRNLRCRIRVRYDGHKDVIPNNVIPNNVIPGSTSVIPGLTRDLIQSI